jgi:demethylmenaquinone methyltransferase/2-methoxy-6-polyprenyl-1,4-benzoquinol methylase
VGAGEKAGMVRAVFDSVAPRYDLMNDLMSLGVHRVWKHVFVTALDPRPRHTLLDLAGGTGDISFGWLRRGGGPAILSDINPSMLRVGGSRDRAGSVGGSVASGRRRRAPAVAGSRVDRVSIAFGLRNCTDKPQVLPRRGAC